MALRQAAFRNQRPTRGRGATGQAHYGPPQRPGFVPRGRGGPPPPFQRGGRGYRRPFQRFSTNAIHAEPQVTPQFQNPDWSLPYNQYYSSYQDQQEDYEDPSLQAAALEQQEEILDIDLYDGNVNEQHIEHDQYETGNPYQFFE